MKKNRRHSRSWGECGIVAGAQMQLCLIRAVIMFYLETVYI